MTEYRYNIYLDLKDGTSILALENAILHSPQYGELTQADILAAIRANPKAYGYAVDRQAGMLYLGSVAIPLESFKALRAELTSMSIIQP